MRKFLVFRDGGRHELSPLTEEEFTLLDRWVGGSDVAYRHFLGANGFRALDEFDSVNQIDWDGGQWVRAGRIELEGGEPVIDWSLPYGSLSFEGGKWIKQEE